MKKIQKMLLFPTAITTFSVVAIATSCVDKDKISLDELANYSQKTEILVDKNFKVFPKFLSNLSEKDFTLTNIPAEEFTKRIQMINFKVSFDEETKQLIFNFLLVSKKEPNKFVTVVKKIAIDEANISSEEITQQALQDYASKLKFSLKEEKNYNEQQISQLKLSDFNIENQNDDFEIVWSPNRKPTIWGKPGEFYLRINYTVLHKYTKIKLNSVKNVYIKLKNFSAMEEYVDLPEIVNSLTVHKATEVTLSHINDGDTFTDSNNNKYRFSGIDTPEKWAFNHSGPTTGMQYEYALKASEFTTNKLTKEAKKIYVVPQKTQGGQTDISDRYGRVVAIIYYLDQNDKVHNLCQEIIASGYAKVAYISKDPNSTFYNSNTAYIDLLKDSERKARESKLGIWSDQADIKQIYPRG
ncbi:thermonuclease family protein [Mycoplasmopsis hyopharyngis]|uniref:thermonuclease family protein n=1 Tax=Mycoplasmopsis hyopharyngis TaxID=29558 RepID=UPI00387306A9